MKILIHTVVAFTISLFIGLSQAQDNALSNYQKIERDFQKSLISAEEAAGLNVLAFFGDSSLPA